MTNFEHIHNMNINELADFLKCLQFYIGNNCNLCLLFGDRCDGDCFQAHRLWLETERIRPNYD